jgi:hypothetical protein
LVGQGNRMKGVRQSKTFTGMLKSATSEACRLSGWSEAEGKRSVRGGETLGYAGESERGTFPPLSGGVGAGAPTEKHRQAKVSCELGDHQRIVW